VRIAAVDSLGKINGPRSVAVLSPFVESPDADLARAALKSLGEIDHPDSLSPLLKALRSPVVDLRLEALKALGARSGKEEVEAIQWTAAADPDQRVAEAAIDALARMATAEAIVALIDLTAEPARREASVEALARLGEQKIGLIGQGLAHAQASVRRTIVEVLRRMKHPTASEMLEGALEDQDATIRLSAVQALAHLGSRRAERKLLAMMRADLDSAVRRAAQKALSR
jgi:HEAT repeat protein